MQKYEYLKDIPVISTIIVLLIGLWGAILNYIKREKEMRNYSITKKISLFIVDLLTSSGFALLTFYGLVGYGVNETISIAIAGVASYHGTKFIYLIKVFIAYKLGEKEIIEAIKEEKDEITT
jgi:uncharacterized membrane protein